MRGEPLDAETIVSATEEVLRRHGPEKTTVLDVARLLGVSHGSVYRHFPSKAALREAVIRRWLDRVRDELAAVVQDPELDPPDRLGGLLTTMFAVKWAKAREDPELFATYGILAADAREVVKGHVDALVDQAARIIADGIKSGAFPVKDAGSAARSVFDATARFHNPRHAAEWSDPGIDAAFEGVWSLIKAALTARPAPKRG